MTFNLPLTLLGTITFRKRCLTTLTRGSELSSTLLTRVKTDLESMDIQSTPSPAPDMVEGMEAHASTPEASEKSDGANTLSAHEASILEKHLAFSVLPGSFFQLYRFATRNDKLIVFISTICAIGGGAAMPLMTVRLNSAFPSR
jgi:hypothetical protein